MVVPRGRQSKSAWSDRGTSYAIQVTYVRRYLELVPSDRLHPDGAVGAKIERNPVAAGGVVLQHVTSA